MIINSPLIHNASLEVNCVSNKRGMKNISEEMRIMRIDNLYYFSLLRLVLK